MFGTSRSTSAPVVSTLASTSAPIATTAVTASPTPSWRSVVFVGRVGLHDVGEVTGVLLDAVRVGVDAEHLVAHVDQRGGERGTEPAEPDHDDLAAVFDRGGAGHPACCEEFVSQ